MMEAGLARVGQIQRCRSMCRGSSGMMIVSMRCVMMARNSMKPLRRTPRGTIDSLWPTTKDSSRAVNAICKAARGISIVK